MDLVIIGITTDTIPVAKFVFDVHEELSSLTFLLSDDYPFFDRSDGEVTEPYYLETIDDFGKVSITETDAGMDEWLRTYTPEEEPSEEDEEEDWRSEWDEMDEDERAAYMEEWEQAVAEEEAMIEAAEQEMEEQEEEQAAHAPTDSLPSSKPANPLYKGTVIHIRNHLNDDITEVYMRPSGKKWGGNMMHRNTYIGVGDQCHLPYTIDYHPQMPWDVYIRTRNGGWASFSRLRFRNVSDPWNIVLTISRKSRTVSHIDIR